MASAHSGYITLGCGPCHSNAFMRAVNGCEQSLEAPIETIPLHETLYEYYNCPSKFIPDSINIFISMYNFGIEFGGLGLFESITNKFIEASNFYKSRLNHFNSVNNG